jgi:hypothetical protein
MRRRWAPDFSTPEMKIAFQEFCASLETLPWIVQNSKLKEDFGILARLLCMLFEQKVMFSFD